MNRSTALLLLFSSLANACASSTVNVRGQKLQRVTLGYTDDHLYLVTHHDAYPEARGASANLRVYDGRISGYACGTDIWAEAEYHRGYLGVLGYVEPINVSAGVQGSTRPLHLEVRDQHGERAIRGSMGDQIGELFSSTNENHGAPGVSGDTGAPAFARSHTIDFAFSTSQLHGVIGPRVYSLQADGSGNLAGTVVIGGRTLLFVMTGADELWSMPPADQAAILPLVLTCDDATAAGSGLLDFSTPPILSVSFYRNRVLH